MIESLKIAKRKFLSEVPGWVAKLQILLGSATGSLTAIAAIPWPGKTAVVGEWCGYGAAACGGIGVLIQFIEKEIKIIDEAEPATASTIKLEGGAT